MIDVRKMIRGWPLRLVLIISCLAVLNMWQYWQAHERHGSESICNEYKESLFNREEVAKSVEASRKNRSMMSDAEYFSDTWPSWIYLPGRTCVGLSDMGIGQSETRCYDDKTGRLIMAYVVPDEGPPIVLFESKDGPDQRR